jgi:hypothetical protein
MPPVPHNPAPDAEDHATLIVAFDAGDLAGDELQRATSLVDACAGCAALRDDLAAIRGAMTALPVPPRRRDYRLTAEDAARLRPSGWRGLVGWLAAPGSSVRPLATGLAALGVAGLLLTAGLPSLGSSASAPLSAVGAPVENPEPYGAGDARNLGATYAPEALPSAAPAAVPGIEASPAPGDVPGTEATAAPSAGPFEVPAAGVAGEASPATTGERNSTTGAPGEKVDGTGATDEAAGGATAGDGATQDATATEPGPPLSVILSAALLAAGIGLFLARAVALRRPA